MISLSRSQAELVQYFDPFCLQFDSNNEPKLRLNMTEIVNSHTDDDKTAKKRNQVWEMEELMHKFSP